MGSYGHPPKSVERRGWATERGTEALTADGYCSGMFSVRQKTVFKRLGDIVPVKKETYFFYFLKEASIFQRKPKEPLTIAKVWRFMDFLCKHWFLFSSVQSLSHV